jgi:Beta protein
MPSDKKLATSKPTKTAMRVALAQIPVTHAGPVFNYKHHVFIAKLKRGEVWALNQLNLATKANLTPLLEMWPPNPATTTKPAKTLTQHTTDLMQLLTTEWTGLPCYLDTLYLQANGVPSPQAADTVFAIARAAQVSAVPVTSPFFLQPFQQVIRNVIATDGRGVLFRIPANFFANPQNIPALDALAIFLAVARNQVDILIDLGYRSDLLSVQQIGAFCLSSVPFINDWRTVTLASGCFPETISNQPIGQWLPFDRNDWLGWSGILQQRGAAQLRLPSYGDYGVRCGGEPQVIPNTPAPNLRYTRERIIWVRRSDKTPGAMRAMCSDLIAQPFFSGAQFSVGDAEIAAKAATTSPANGSPEQWIQWCTNHHLELTASQIQSLP